MLELARSELRDIFFKHPAFERTSSFYVPDVSGRPLVADRFSRPVAAA